MNINLVIISLLDGKGPTGVEAHFNQLIEQAQVYGINNLFISPYSSRKLWRKCAGIAVKITRLFSKEHAEILERKISSKIIESIVRSALQRRTNRGDPVTLYAQDPLSAATALRVKKDYPCRVVAVIHYNISEAYELLMRGEARVDGPLWRFAMATERHALPEVDQIIFVSDFMRKVMLERLPKISAVAHSVIPNFVAAEKIDIDEPGITGDIIAIGTLEPRKNQEFLLRVLAKASSLGCKYTLTLVGNGPDMEKLKLLARELRIEDQVRFAGFQKNAARLIPQHRILAHAAKVENMPITLIEALALGRPILAPAVGGIPEIFDHGVEGYYWPLEDVDTAATLLVKALSDAETYRRFTQAALVRYQTKFDSNRLVDRWMAAIFNLQSKQHAPSPEVHLYQ